MSTWVAARSQVCDSDSAIQRDIVAPSRRHGEFLINELAVAHPVNHIQLHRGRDGPHRHVQVGDKLVKLGRSDLLQLVIVDVMRQVNRRTPSSGACPAVGSITRLKGADVGVRGIPGTNPSQNLRVIELSVCTIKPPTCKTGAVSAIKPKSEREFAPRSAGFKGKAWKAYLALVVARLLCARPSVFKDTLDRRNHIFISQAVARSICL